MNAQTKIPPLAGAGAEAESFRQSRSALWRIIYDTVRSYRMSNMMDADDPTIAYPLVDLMSNPGPATIATGEHEMAMLTDEIIAALIPVAPKADDPQIGAELVPGAAELLKRIDKRSSYFGDVITTAEYLVIQDALRLASAQAAQRTDDLPEQLRAARMMVNYGNGDVRDEPDPLHEAAATEIERLRDQNAAKSEMIARARSSAKLWAGLHQELDESARELRAKVRLAETAGATKMAEQIVSPVDERVVRLIAEAGDIPVEKVKPDLSLIGDLGFDRLDLIELAIALESEFRVEIAEPEMDIALTPRAIQGLITSKASAYA